MSGKLNFGIIGCGRIAHRHATEIKKHGNLASVCDIDQRKADEFAEKFSSTASYSIKELLSQNPSLDILAVCTPNGLHAEHSIQALDAGINVLCEKPMAIAVLDAEKMIAVAARNNKKLFVVKQNRFNPPVVFVKDLLTQQKLGKIAGFQLNCFWNRPAEYYLNSWRGSKNLDGGTLFTQFSHFIDVLYWFLGDIKSISGYRKNELHKNSIEFEDSGVIALETTSGAIGTINYCVNTWQKNMEGSFTLFGEKGTVKIGGQYLNELEYFAVENEKAPALAIGSTANQYGFYEGSMSNHDKVYSSFIEAIHKSHGGLPEADETMKTVAIIEKIYQHTKLLS